MNPKNVDKSVKAAVLAAFAAAGVVIKKYGPEIKKYGPEIIKSILKALKKGA